MHGSDDQALYPDKIPMGVIELYTRINAVSWSSEAVRCGHIMGLIERGI